jgi:hypothetical protein
MTPIWPDNAAFEDAPLHLAAASSSMVLTLAYFSVFKHPLREEELLAYTHFYAISREEGKAAIRSLLDRGILESKRGMLCLRGDGSMAAIRVEREARAALWKPRVEQSIRVLSHLPFLRGLSISGSMSKGTQDPDGDIDFFVLTAPNRLWTTRFFASLMLKFMPRVKKEHYCLNYYLPEDRLSIPDRTLFSATEVAFLKPVLNGELLCAFFEMNPWVKAFYPNWQAPASSVPGLPRPLLQRIAEWPLSGILGDLVEAQVSRWFIRRLNRQMGALPQDHSASEVRFRQKEYKGHTKGHHEKTHQAWLHKVERLETDLGIQLIRWPWAEAWTSRKVEAGASHFQGPLVALSRPVLPLKVTSRRVLQPH